ncbi:DNA-directed RNA polymerase, mitochondrial isoform X4 [Geospiza fortis]|uniref:DNA-directed RNA polymerase n=1 Tax=Geospiza fortis TaxID=48883 RepID=A0A8N5F344_GEOFO|nr:DNA-directed RNA polymerase, mitochondrial isoform X4 [Geospiza fortis]
MSLLRLRAVLRGPGGLRGPGIPWRIFRSYSSASTKEKANRNGPCERTELLEVLKARAKQLQGSNIPEVTVSKVELAALDNDKYQEAVVPGPKEKQPIPRAKGNSLAHSSTWAKKLQKEMYSQQPKMKQELGSAASQLALGSQAKAEATPKTKAMKSPKIPKTKAATAWTQSSGSPHSKPRVVEVKGAAELKRPQRMPKDKSNQQVLQQTIQANLECFLFLQRAEEAERYLLLCHSSPVKRKVLDVGAFNVVMRIWARKGCLNRLDRLFSILEAAGLQPNLDSYAAALECTGRSQSPPKAILRYLQQLNSSGFHVDELFQKCLFEEDEKEMVLRAIRTVQPNYQLPPPPSPRISKSSLLQDFYSRETMGSYPKLDFSMQELQERFQQQLEMELKNTVTIDSVEAAKPLTPQAIKARELLGTLRSQWRDAILQALQNSKRSMARPKRLSKYNILYHVYSFYSNWQVGLIRPHPIFSQLVSNAAETTLTFNSSAMPMLCPPVPWTSPTFGAFVLNDTKLMRFMDDTTHHQLLLEQCPLVNLHPVLDALNQLGNCAWKINQPVLDIIISIFNDKGDEKLDIPPPLSEAPKPPTPPGNSSTWSKSFKHEVFLCKKKAAEMHSLRMDALYKLSIANYVRDKVFWFPHNMDFRGRTYPCPPYFNHLGNDVTRAILLFAEGKPLGPKGLDWLKIHLINLTGLKKKNALQERLEYANEIMEDILDSADHPLTGRKWWMDTDEPWQALACCMEIAKASRSPDPAAYISHFPVHQDGSCNGLQHYAALGRDLSGAASVNLVPCGLPQDVYSAVAQQVEEFRKKDAERGLKVAQVLQGFISRKVVKQTVMTVVYGVTRYGGRLQIEKRLKEIDEFPEEYLWEASHYLVKQVFNSIKEMFSATRDIQNWLTESAKLIAQSGRTVEWVTPLGLPIIQPYYRSRSTVLNCGMQRLSVKTSNSSQKPDTVKQKNAFPPNFIHSLDSTHMMLTALHCLRKGLTFVSVHDCYWTHALTVDVMNQVCRQQFVALHSEKILQDLSEFMLEKYCSSSSSSTEPIAHWQKRLKEQLSNVPSTGEFNLKQVMDSTYFFS